MGQSLRHKTSGVVVVVVNVVVVVVVVVEILST